ncbi:CTP synthase [Mycoplasma testudineum]|uniref:CTP synthase (glutamine hydrolyzing) n=1 Tax=Mycoplasma testudineum TaxID=244584 RepID=A0A4R6IG79_9MOLU|nr:CTP synthase [Mycoplasma testudineum]OYD27178.1 CTP synthetase [Mycoplasma testudineum]TDO21064.1 CTP synthase [Mycoplasma testudineum]
METKFIFVTGGVISGLGKGISAASIGNILRARGYSLFVLKLDPYLNIDPGVMSPYEHGEVYVTEDGGETDLDLGHYERFIDVNLSKDSNWTSGRIYQRLFSKERDGIYGGKTVQTIPHLTNEIINIIQSTAQNHKPDFMIVEVGGTVGDIESDPFIYAIAKMKIKNPEQIFLAHVTYVPHLKASNEFKSKPTQNSLSTLRSFGIKPDLVLLRNENLVPHEIVSKIAAKATLENDEVISVPDLENIYYAPLYYEKENAAKIIEKYFNLEIRKGDFYHWNKFVELIYKPKKYSVKLLMVGKYIEFLDAYKSIIEAFKVAAYHENVELILEWKDAAKIVDEDITNSFKRFDGVVILPGFGKRGFEGKVKTAIHTRENKIPTLGICLGMQAMTVAQARLKGFSTATSAEFAGTFKENEIYVLDILKGKQKDKNLGGTLRLGDYPVELEKDSLARKIYGHDSIVERHRHRYEVSEEFRKKLEDDNFKFSGIYPEKGLAEIAEVKNHPFYLGTQFHPEFTNRPLKGHPLFKSFIKKIVEIKKGE